MWFECVRVCNVVCNLSKKDQRGAARPRAHCKPGRPPARNRHSACTRRLDNVSFLRSFGQCSRPSSVLTVSAEETK